MWKLFLPFILAGVPSFGVSITYQYDAAGRVISASYDNGTTVTYTYDKAGNLAGRTVPGAVPSISGNGIGNSATYVAPLVRGELATVFGQNLSLTTASASTLPLPTTLYGVQVTVGGILAPIYYVSPTQINFQVPFETPITGSVAVVAKLYGTAGNAQQVSVAEYAPAIYGYARTATTIDPVIVHAATFALVSPDNPAQAGESLVIFATGAGSFDSTPPPTGAPASATPLLRTQIAPSVTFGGAPAEVQFAGLAPGYVGLLQINVALPATLSSGTSLPLVLQFGNAAAPAVSVYVK